MIGRFIHCFKPNLFDRRVHSPPQAQFAEPIDGEPIVLSTHQRLKFHRRRGAQVLVKLGDKEVDVSKDFKLYITTRLPNPTYPPEVTTRVALINFAVKQQGLEGQLLAAVVKHERPDLDAQKNELVVKVRRRKRYAL